LTDQQTFSAGARLLLLDLGTLTSSDYYLGVRSTLGSAPSQVWWPETADVHIYNTTSFTRLASGGKLSFHDANGHVVSVSYSGPGFVDFSTDNGLTGARAAGNLQQIIMGNTTAKSALKIVTRGASTPADDLYVRGPAKSVSAPTLSMLGDVTVNGALSGLSLGDMPNGGSIDIGGTPADAPLSVSLGDVDSVDLISGVPIKSLSVADWGMLDSGAKIGLLQAPRLDKLTASGDFLANLKLLGMTPADGKAPAKTLGAAKIAGDVQGQWDITGDVGSLDVGGSVTSSIIHSSGGMDKVTVGASDGSDFLAGIAYGPRHAQASADYASQATIKSFTVRGSKDAALAGALFQDSNVSAYVVGKVSLLNVNNTNTGTDFGIFGQSLGSVRVTDKLGGIGWNWKAGDPIPADPLGVGDFTVRRV
jgi:hypothetical protein